MQEFKQKTHQHYLHAVQLKIEALEKKSSDLKESLQQETKSTAGDKYETSRAMVHIEQQNIAGQLSVLLQQKAILESISPNNNMNNEIIQFGNLVKTNKGFIFIAAALGKASVESETVFAISMESPLGKLLLGKTIDDTATIQSTTYKIEGIY